MKPPIDRVLTYFFNEIRQNNINPSIIIVSISTFEKIGDELRDMHSIVQDEIKDITLAGCRVISSPELEENEIIVK